MSLRISSLVLALALAACSNETQPVASEGAETIACALGGAEKFENGCAVERSVVDGRLALTVRHPDGGFRRFDVVDDGRGVAVADGSDEAKSTLLPDGLLEVTVAGDRYRFPARAKPADGAGR